MYTNRAYTFQVASDYMVKFIYKNDKVSAETGGNQPPAPGQPVVRISDDGHALCN
jgi:hypothetical protein